MNYIEYVLQRSEKLWQEQEQRLQETAEPGGTDANARLARRLFSAEKNAFAKGKNPDAGADTMRGELAVQSVYGGMTAEEGSRRSDGAANWLSEMLRSGATEGIAAAGAQERVTEFLPLRDTAELQALSQSAERDARRYDGGFLLY